MVLLSKEASHHTSVGLVGSQMTRHGAEIRACFKASKAVISFSPRVTGAVLVKRVLNLVSNSVDLRISVRGFAIDPKPFTNFL